MINKIKITLFSLLVGIFVVGCSEDDDPVAADSCTTNLMTYSENATGLFDGTATQEECEAAYTAIMEYCADGCEPEDTPADEQICTGMSELDAATITALCGGDSGGGDDLTTYEFTSRFQNTSSVKYTGQTVRNLLIRDIKGNVADGVTAAELLVFYNNSDATAEIATSSSYDADQTLYHDISTSNLSGKIASSSFDFDPGNVIGYDMTPDALVNAWFTAAESEGQETSDGVNVSQMVAKGLAAMVAYYQATSVYFHPNKLDVADNTVSANDEYGYTSMEHYWDESFGYFGASVDYLNLSNANQRGAYDTDMSGSIDYKTEYNFDWAAYAAKRDDCTGCDHDGSFASTIMSAYIDGREAITAGGGVSSYDPHRMTIANTWEKVVAANIVHYANSVQEDIASGSSDLNKHWSEMRAFGLALQFNYYKVISDSDLTEMITLMGNAPSSDVSYVDTMEQVKTMIGEVYMFTANDLANW